MSGFGLVGRHLSHSYSVEIHKLLADYDYRLYEKEPEELCDFVHSCGLDGFNVTVPYKRKVYEMCDALSNEAREIGCVNTVINKGGRLIGENTDAFGFRYLLQKNGISPAGKKTVILGSGGASKAVAYILNEMCADRITNVSRNGKYNYDNIEALFDSEIIINATPVGMYPNNGESLINVSRFKKCEAVIDLIYNPLRTKLVSDALSLGIKSVNGLQMLAAQAAKSCELFGYDVDYSKVEDICKSVSDKVQNIILIGMPSCGKSSVGKRLAEIMRRPFIDCDSETEKRIGDIGDYILKNGEAAFRMAENETLKDISSRSGYVIACGGGVVENDDNLELLRQNGKVIFIDRDISELVTESRPLSELYGIDALAQKRIPIYIKWADAIYKNIGINETAKDILSDVQEGKL